MSPKPDDIDQELANYLEADDEKTPTTERTYVLGKLIAIVERAEHLMMDVGVGDPDDPDVQRTIIRGVSRLRGLLQDIERHLIARRHTRASRP